MVEGQASGGWIEAQRLIDEFGEGASGVAGSGGGRASASVGVAAARQLLAKCILYYWRRPGSCSLSLLTRTCIYTYTYT